MIEGQRLDKEYAMEDATVQDEVNRMPVAEVAGQ
jgi:hypothetical protein